MMTIRERIDWPMGPKVWWIPGLECGGGVVIKYGVDSGNG